MANYSREEAEKLGNAEVGVAGGLLAGLAALVVGGAVSSSRKNKKKEEINQRIQEINEEINAYRSKFLGSTMYANEISALERERDELKEKREKL